MEEKQITFEIKKPEIIFLLGFLAVVLILELLVTVPSPIVFGDEGYHTRISQYIAQNKDYPAWNPVEGTKIVKFAFSRPPVWNLLEAGFYLILGFHEIIVKFLAPFISFLTGIVVYILGKKFYNKEVGIIAAVITVTISSFVTYSVLFYADILFTFFFLIFSFFLILALEAKNKKYWIVAGIFAAIAFLTKTPGVIVVVMIGLTFLYELYKQKNIVSVLKSYMLLLLPMIFILGMFFLRNLASYNTISCDLPIFSSMGTCQKTIQYQNTYKFAGTTNAGGTETGVFNLGIINYLGFAYGNPWLYIFTFMAGLAVLIIRKGRTDTLIFFILISFIPIFYMSTLEGGRAEDTARFMLASTPFLALISANYFEAIYMFTKKHYKYLALIVFVVILVLGSLNMWQKLFGYTSNGQKISGMTDVKQFPATFFDACNFIKRNTTQNILISTVWDHQTVYNCQRDAVCFGCLPDSGDMFLSGNLDLMLSRLKLHGITHIFIQKFSISQKELSSNYPINFVQFLNSNPDHFKKIFENGETNLDNCLNGCDGTLVYEVKF